MPKEITHLSLAAKVYNKFSSDSIFFQPIKNYYHLFLYGSVAPDSMFYYLLGPKSRSIQALSKQLHTSGSSSLSPVIEFLNHFYKKNPAAVSFASGMICHVLSDSVFHPLVYYFAGMDEIHKGATTRHRTFETALDYHFWPDNSNTQMTSLYQILKQSNISKRQIAFFFEKLFKLESNPDKRLMIFGIKSHIFFQYLFKAPNVLRFFDLLKYLGFNLPPKNRALLYHTKAPVKLKFFNNKIKYKDPCKGFDNHFSVDELSEKAVEQILQVFNIFESVFKSDNSFDQVNYHSDLPDICPGIIPEENPLKYWHGQNDIEEMIYKNSSSKEI